MSFDRFAKLAIAFCAGTSVLFLGVILTKKDERKDRGR